MLNVVFAMITSPTTNARVQSLPARPGMTTTTPPAFFSLNRYVAAFRMFFVFPTDILTKIIPEIVTLT